MPASPSGGEGEGFYDAAAAASAAMYFSVPGAVSKTAISHQQWMDASHANHLQDREATPPSRPPVADDDEACDAWSDKTPVSIAWANNSHTKVTPCPSDHVEGEGPQNQVQDHVEREGRVEGPQDHVGREGPQDQVQMPAQDDVKSRKEEAIRNEWYVKTLCSCDVHILLLGIARASCLNH